MFDYLLCYTTEAERPAVPSALAAFEDGAGRTWMPVSCILDEGTFDPVTGEVITSPVLAPGLWMVVRAETRQADLEADPSCLIVTDSERAARGLPFVLVSKLLPETPLGRVSPVFAGDAYPFPQGPASGLLPLMVEDA